MQHIFELDFVSAVFCQRNFNRSFNVSVDFGKLPKINLLQCLSQITFQLVPFSNEFLSLLGYGIAITVQIFMYCWFGNEVEVKVKQSQTSNSPAIEFVRDLEQQYSLRRV
jgi:hypothetical protein